MFQILKPFLQLFGLKYLASGFWIFASIFLSHIIRKPGIAILASLVAAFVEGFISQWGLMSLVWGLVQGLGAEIVFFIFSYHKWDWKVLTLASVFSAVFSYTLDYFYYSYSGLNTTLNITQLLSFIVSSIFLAGFLSYWLGEKLIKTGLLNNFLIVKNRV